LGGGQGGGRRRHRTTSVSVVAVADGSGQDGEVPVVETPAETEPGTLLRHHV
jgi:hypothetical protein